MAVPKPTNIEVLTLPSQRVRFEGVTQHRSIGIPIPELTSMGAVPITSVARTLVDCVPHVSGRGLERAVDDACRQGLVSVPELVACVGRLDRGGRRRLVPLRVLLADRLPGHAPGGSQRELDVMMILLRAGLPAPVQQHLVVV
ncbi:MAG TPA: hypothetical protein VK988_15495, partial [Acidimicrobiales bacterium]|nr:hypothetical protein [Acidimicrobiales bacterium]